MKKPQYFTLYEMVYSETALYSKIPNIPNWGQVENLNRLSLWLDDVRCAYGEAIHITSGFRCPRLNKAVGGVANSQHLKGLAADLRASDLKRLKQSVIDSGIPFDQLIEESKGNTKWLHISISENGKAPRKQVLTITL